MKKLIFLLSLLMGTLFYQSVKAFSNNESSNTFDGSQNLLALPVVSVPDGNGGAAKYAALLQVDLKSDPIQFSLLSANPTEGKETAYFDAGTGMLAFPLDLGLGTKYWIENQLNGSVFGTLKFNVSKIDLPSAPILTVSKAGAGNVSGDSQIDCGAKCWGRFTSGKQVTLTATPTAPQANKVDWAGCNTVTATNQCQVTITGLKKVEATFSLDNVATSVDNPNGYESTPAPNSTISFGTAAVHTTKLAHLSIKELQGKILDLRLAGINGENAEDFSILDPAFPIKLPSGISQPVILQCKPSSEGLRQAILTLRTNDSTKPIVTYTLECTGSTNSSGAIYWANYVPDSDINFGGIATNLTTTKTIDVVNNGQAPLTLAFKTIDGANPSDFKVEGFNQTIAPNGKLSIPIKFTPSSLEAKTATLHLESNDPDNKTIQYQLKGKGDIVCITDFPPIDDPTGIKGILGGGYDSKRDRFKPERCLNGTFSNEGGSSGTVNMDIKYTQKDLYKKFGATLNGNATLGLFKLSAAASFLQETIETSLSKSFVFGYKLEFPNRRFALDYTKPLSEIGALVVNSLSCFSNICGTHYISQVKQEAEMYFAVSFNFSSKQKKEQFEAEFNVKYGGGLASLKGAVNSLSTEVKKSGSINMKAMQNGGDATQLANIFGTTSGEIAPIIQCTLDNFAKCEAVIDKALSYARNDFSKQLQKPESWYTSDYYFSRYDEIPIGAPVASPVDPEVTLAREELRKEYEREVANLRTINALTNATDIPTDIKKNMPLATIRDSINTNIALIRSAAAWCFSDVTQCIAKKNQTLDSLLAYQTVIPFFSTTSAQTTIAAFSSGGWASCPNRTSTVCLPSGYSLDTTQANGQGYVHTYSSFQARPAQCQGWDCNEFACGGTTSAVSQNSSGQWCLITTVSVSSGKRGKDNGWSCQVLGSGCSGPRDSDKFGEGTYGGGTQTIFGYKADPNATITLKSSARISLIKTSAIGTTDNLVGKVTGIVPLQYVVLSYIFVPLSNNGVDAWWGNKPAFNETTPINADGTFTLDFTTDGAKREGLNDAKATVVKLYVVPNTFTPPQVNGTPTLPTQLDDNAVAKLSITR